MSSRIQFSQGVEISRPSKIQQRQRMIAYARNFRGIRQNRGKSKQQVQTVTHKINKEVGP